MKVYRNSKSEVMLPLWVFETDLRNEAHLLRFLVRVPRILCTIFADFFLPCRNRKTGRNGASEKKIVFGEIGEQRQAATVCGVSSPASRILTRTLFPYGRETTVRYRCVCFRNEFASRSGQGGAGRDELRRLRRQFTGWRGSRPGFESQLWHFPFPHRLPPFNFYQPWEGRLFSRIRWV